MHTLAADILIPPQHWRRFVSKTQHHGHEEIIAFATSLSIALGIVVGRLQHDGLLGYDQRHDLKMRYIWAEGNSHSNLGSIMVVSGNVRSNAFGA